MKSKLFIITLLCFSKNLIAQDSLRVETVVDSSFKTPQYVAAYDDVFLSHQETKWLVKVDFMGLLLNKELKLNSQSFLLNTPIRNATNYSSGIQTASLSFERKLTTNLSVNAQIASTQNFLDRSAPFRNMPLALTIEPRFYFRKKDEIKNGKSANNLNGSYIGISLSYYTPSVEGLTSAALGNDKLLWSANYGFQKRIFNHWYLDYKMGLGFYKADRYVYSPILTIIPKDKWRVDLINQFSIGYTFGSGKHKNINSCDIFRCFEEEKSLWKIDVRQIFNNNQYYLSSYLMTGYEQKLGNSAWSLNTELKGGFSRYSGSSPNFRYNSYSVSATIEPRYYYNLKKRISTGLSVNNLSGCYISLAMTKGYGKSVFSGKYYPSNEEFKGRYEEQPLFIIPKWGIQKRIFKHGFADFSLAPIRFNKTFYDNTYNSVQNNTKSKGSTQSWQYSTIGKIPVPIADFKIGFAF